MDNYQIISKFINDHRYLEDHMTTNTIRGMSLSSELIPVGYSSLVSIVGEDRTLFCPSQYITSNDLNGFSTLRRSNGNTYFVCINNDHIPILKEQLMRAGMGYPWNREIVNTIDIKTFMIKYEVPMTTYKQSPIDLKAKLKEIEDNIDTYRNRLIKSDTVTTEDTAIEQPVIL